MLCVISCHKMICEITLNCFAIWLCKKKKKQKKTTCEGHFTSCDSKLVVYFWKLCLLLRPRSKLHFFYQLLFYLFFEASFFSIHDSVLPTTLCIRA